MTTPPTGLPESLAAPASPARPAGAEDDAVEELMDQAYWWGYEACQEEHGTHGSVPMAKAHENSAKEIAASLRARLRAPSDARGGERDLQERIAAIVLDREEGRIPTRLMTADRILDAVFADELDVQHAQGWQAIRELEEEVARLRGALERIVPVAKLGVEAQDDGLTWIYEIAAKALATPTPAPPEAREERTMTGLPESPAPAPETNLRDLLIRCDSLISWSLHRHTWPADVQQDMRDTLADLRKCNREPPAPSVEERAGQPSEGSTALSGEGGRCPLCGARGSSFGVAGRWLCENHHEWILDDDAPDVLARPGGPRDPREDPSGWTDAMLADLLDAAIHDHANGTAHAGVQWAMKRVAARLRAPASPGEAPREPCRRCGHPPRDHVGYNNGCIHPHGAGSTATFCGCVGWVSDEPSPANPGALP